MPPNKTEPYAAKKDAASKSTDQKFVTALQEAQKYVNNIEAIQQREVCIHSSSISLQAQAGAAAVQE